jgi:5'-deoxynucleotidase YfbR-like HD superfamily hydrolase
MNSLGKPDLRQLEKLMTTLVFPFYQVERDAVPPLKSRRFENDAEHSWSVALLACSLASEIDKGLNIGKVAQFAIVHDLVEVFAGDTSPWQESEKRKSKERREEEALRRIKAEFSNLPWIADTIEEYEAKSCNEAKYVWAVDKLIILLLRYIDRGQFYVDTGVTKKLFDERLVQHRKKAHAHPVVGEYYDQLLRLFDAHPEYFSAPRNRS